MIMSDVLFWFLIVLGFYLAFNSYWLLAAALFPNTVEQCRLRYAEKPVRSTFTGLLVSAPILIGAFVLITHMGNPLFQITGIGIIAVVVMLGLLGSTGLCSQIGQGLPAADDAAWRRVGRGGLLLGMAFILPVVGWFVLMPWTFISGFGAFVRVRFARRKARAGA